MQGVSRQVFYEKYSYLNSAFLLYKVFKYGYSMKGMAVENNFQIYCAVELKQFI